MDGWIEGKRVTAAPSNVTNTEPEGLAVLALLRRAWTPVPVPGVLLGVPWRGSSADVPGAVLTGGEGWERLRLQAGASCAWPLQRERARFTGSTLPTASPSSSPYKISCLGITV